MKYPTTLIIAALFCSTAVAAPEPVTCDSPCDCHNAHGEGRWSVKSDPSLPPTFSRSALTTNITLAIVQSVAGTASVCFLKSSYYRNQVRDSTDRPNPHVRCQMWPVRGC